MRHEAVGYTCHFPSWPSGGHDLDGSDSSSDGECDNHCNDPQPPDGLCQSMHEAAENHRSSTHKRLYELMWQPFAGRLVFASDAKVQKMDTHSISQYVRGAKVHDLENQSASLVVLFETKQCKGTDRDREHALLAPQSLDKNTKTWFNHHVLCVHV